MKIIFLPFLRKDKKKRSPPKKNSLQSTERRLIRLEYNHFFLSLFILCYVMLYDRIKGFCLRPSLGDFISIWHKGVNALFLSLSKNHCLPDRQTERNKFDVLKAKRSVIHRHFAVRSSSLLHRNPRRFFRVVFPTHACNLCSNNLAVCRKIERKYSGWLVSPRIRDRGWNLS